MSSNPNSNLSATQSVYSIFRLHKHTIAGLGAGAVSTFALYPLDLLKTHYQVHETSSYAYKSVGRGVASIVRNGGIKALYRGMSPALYGATASWGLYFFFYERAKERYSRLTKSTKSWHHFASGLEAGAMCIPFTNPIWLIKVRMQVQANTPRSSSGKSIVPYTSVADAFRRILKEEGVTALYKGSVPALLLTTHGAFKFLAYEKLKCIAHDIVGSDLMIVHTLSMGAIAQAFASATTYPYQVVKARLQQGGDAANKYFGTIHCLKHIVRNEGIRGLYKGLSPNLMKVVPSGALTFAIYEQIISFLK